MILFTYCLLQLSATAILGTRRIGYRAWQYWAINIVVIASFVLGRFA